MEIKTRLLPPIKLEIKTEYDVGHVRRQVRKYAEKARFNLSKQTRIITAASEIAQNIFKYAGAGTVQIELITGKSSGLRLIFKDEGPGMDIKQAMTDGFSTGKSLGLGLSGAKRLVDEFEINSAPGKGTQINMLIWE